MLSSCSALNLVSGLGRRGEEGRQGGTGGEERGVDMCTRSFWVRVKVRVTWFIVRLRRPAQFNQFVEAEPSHIHGSEFSRCAPCMTRYI